MVTGTIKRKPSMKPNIPLTWMTRQLKEMVEKGGDLEGDGEGEGGGDTGTLTRRPRSTRSDDSTLKRHHTIGKYSMIFESFWLRIIYLLSSVFVRALFAFPNPHTHVRTCIGFYQQSKISLICQVLL